MIFFEQVDYKLEKIRPLQMPDLEGMLYMWKLKKTSYLRKTRWIKKSVVKKGRKKKVRIEEIGDC